MAEATTDTALETLVRDAVLPNPTGFLGWYNALLAVGVGVEQASELATYICDAVVAERTRSREIAEAARELLDADAILALRDRSYTADEIQRPIRARCALREALAGST